MTQAMRGNGGWGSGSQGQLVRSTAGEQGVWGVTGEFPRFLWSKHLKSSKGLGFYSSCSTCQSQSNSRGPCAGTQLLITQPKSATISSVLTATFYCSTNLALDRPAPHWTVRA